MSKRSVFAATLLAAALAAGEAGACRLPPFVTLWDRLPEAADRQHVVAKVEVIELLQPPSWMHASDFSPFVKVRVIEAIKGVRLDQIFTVDTGASSCDLPVHRDDIGRRAYVAGRFWTSEAGETHFIGSHSRFTGRLLPSD